MKVEVYCDEYYPYYAYLSPPSGFSGQVLADIDAATWRRWKRVFEQFHAVQAEIATAYEGGAR